MRSRTGRRPSAVARCARRRPRAQLTGASRLVRRVLAAASALLLLGEAPRADAQVAQADVRDTLFLEPSKTSKLFVMTPSATVAAQPTDWLDVHAGYEADIVTGATEPIKSGALADVVTAATHFSDVRHEFHGGVGVVRRDAHVTVDYSYGTESDYRSQGLSVSAGSDFFQKNTQIELQYARAASITFAPRTTCPRRRRRDARGSIARRDASRPRRTVRAARSTSTRFRWAGRRPGRRCSPRRRC